jgi:hypothetical protein
MMRALTMSFLVGFAIASHAAQAEDSSNSPSTATAVPAAAPSAPASDSDPIICKNEHITGSHFTQKVCAKQSQWDAVDDKSVNALKQKVDQSRQATLPGG